MTFYYAGFEANLANDEDGAAPQVQVSIPNADRSIVVSVDIEVVFADTPDEVEIALKGMEMTEITYDESVISGIISRDLLFDEPYPYRSFTPQHFPFLFSTRTSM